MNRQSRYVSSLDDLPQIPASVTTRDGVMVDPRPDEWSIPSLQRGSRRVNFSKFASLTATFRHKLKLEWALALETSASASVANSFDRFFGFYQEELSHLSHPCNEIELAHILSYRAKLDSSTEWKMASVRSLLIGMAAHGYGACSIEVLDYLKQATFKNNVTGTSVRIRDPKNGAFNDTELLAMHSALNDAYANGQIDLCVYAMAWLFLAYGMRPIQIAALKEKDLVVSANANNDRRYALRIPRAKQGGVIRDKFTMRYCSKPIGQLLTLLIERNCVLKTDPTVADGDWPLFIGDNEGVLPDLRYHVSASHIGNRLERSLSRIMDLKANARRFRMTMAQRAVDDGKDKYTVAEMLDHADTQCVGIYFEASPATVDRLDRHLAMELAPLAQAFAGVLVASPAGANCGDNARNRIYDKTLPNNVDRPLGVCGQMSFCGLHAPFACYTCRHFQPWLNAPHEEFLQALIGERDRMIAKGYSPKIYNIHRRTILAVAQVIKLCNPGREMAEEET